MSLQETGQIYQGEETQTSLAPDTNMSRRVPMHTLRQIMPELEAVERACVVASTPAQATSLFHSIEAYVSMPVDHTSSLGRVVCINAKQIELDELPAVDNNETLALIDITKGTVNTELLHRLHDEAARIVLLTTEGQEICGAAAEIVADVADTVEAEIVIGASGQDFEVFAEPDALKGMIYPEPAEATHHRPQVIWHTQLPS